MSEESKILKNTINMIIKHSRLSQEVVTCDVDRTFRLHTASLHQAMMSTGYASPFKQDAPL